MLVKAGCYADTAGVTGRYLTLGMILLAALNGACASRAGVPRPFPGASPPPTAAEPAPDGPIAAAPPVVAAALAFRGVPYRNGGSDPSGFDCSGFVQYVFAQFGAPLPREVRDQFREGRSVDLDEVEPGDLLFFETVSRGASHVGLAIGAGEFVHAPSSRGVVRVERYDAAYWARRFVGARRVFEASARRDRFPGAVHSSK